MFMVNFLLTVNPYREWINREKIYDKVVFSDVYLKVEKTSDKENKTINVPMIDFGKKQCKTFEEAVELAES
jgi:putative sigma-54 modulation protein